MINNGLAPAGGCVVLVSNIKLTASPVANAKVNGVTAKNSTKHSPKAIINNELSDCLTKFISCAIVKKDA